MTTAMRQSLEHAAPEELCSGKAGSYEPDSSANPPTMLLLNHSTALYLCPPVVLFGLATNLVCCVALRRCRYRPATAALVYALIALVDSLVLALTFADSSLPVLLAYWGSDWYLGSGVDYYLPTLSALLFAPLAHLLHRFTALLVLLITFDRYVVVFKLCGRTRCFVSARHVLAIAAIAFLFVCIVQVRAFVALRSSAVPSGPRADPSQHKSVSGPHCTQLVLDIWTAGSPPAVQILF